MKNWHIPIMGVIILIIWTLDIMFYKNKLKEQRKSNNEIRFLSFKEGCLRGSLNYQNGKTFNQQWPIDSANFVKMYETP